MSVRKTWPSLVCILVLILGLSCVIPFSEPVRERINKDITFEQLLIEPDSYRGQVILVGGQIIETVPKEGQTELTVLQRPLSFDYSPLGGGDETGGRFILMVKGFLDPAVYSPGRKITTAAEVDGVETREIGQTSYLYPVLKALEIRLWPVPPQPAYIRQDPLDNLLWGPYGEPYWGPPHPWRGP